MLLAADYIQIMEICATLVTVLSMCAVLQSIMLVVAAQCFCDDVCLCHACVCASL